MGRFIGLMLLCAMLTVGCQSPQGSGSAGSTGGDPNRITLGTTAKVRTLDPADSYEILSGNLLYNLGDRLYAAWARQADLEKLGVSCGRSLTVATPII